MRPQDKLILPGGAGLVGQNLVLHLKQAGYSRLVVLDKHKANLAILKRLHPDVTAMDADLADAGDWQAHFEGAAAVVMLQAQIGGLDPRAFIRNNVDSTRNVLDAVKRHQVPYVVHVSSSVVESVANDHYTNSKKAQEELFLSSGVAGVVLRPTLMFGCFDRKHLGWLSRFMRKVPVFPIPGDGRFLRQPLYAGDFAAIIASCLRQAPPQRVYDITGREKIDYLGLIREVRRACGSTTRIVHIPYGAFRFLLQIWALFDRDPPFTADQLKALCADDIFDVIDWPAIFGVEPTPLAEAMDKTFRDPVHSPIVLEF